MSQKDVQHELVFLVDVDNTLINNDQVKTDVDQEMKAIIGEEETAHFWKIYEQVRKDLDGVDIPATLRRLETSYSDKALFNRLYRLWMDFPYRDYIYTGAFEALSHLKSIGLPVILSDGDASFQLRKIVKSGLSKAVDGNVLIYLHKDRHYEDIDRSFSAKHYVMIEDKPTLLAKGKIYFEDRLTSVLIQQGKYSKEQAHPTPDLTLPSIAEISNLTKEQFEG